MMVDLEDPDEETVVSVLGKSHGDVAQYSEEEQQHFDAYHRRFKLDSKPAAHLDALAELDEEDLKDNMPDSIDRLLKNVIRPNFKNSPMIKAENWRARGRSRRTERPNRCP